MIYFDNNHPKVKDALYAHLSGLKDKIWKKVQSYKKGEYAHLLNPYTIEAILCMEPKKLYQMNIFFYRCKITDFKLKDFEHYLSLSGNQEDMIKNKFNEVNKDLDKLFDYKSFCVPSKNYSAYDLANKLDIPTCTYCNRMYTKTVINEVNKKVTRPTFDHWYPKSKFPLLKLSFYNLIPSCTVCNSGNKGSAVFNLKGHFHPYVKTEHFNYSFSYDHCDYSKFKFKIITDNHFSQTSINAFELEEIYKAHEDEIADLRSIRDNYSHTYLDSLRVILNETSINLSDAEIYRLAFGVHLEEDKLDRRPLSKMKKDILKELGIIS